MFNDGHSKGVYKFDIYGLDKTHKDFMRDEVFVIPILPGSFDESIKNYLLKHHNSPGKFYTHLLSQDQIKKNEDIPGMYKVRFKKNIPVGRNLFVSI